MARITAAIVLGLFVTAWSLPATADDEPPPPDDVPDAATVDEMDDEPREETTDEDATDSSDETLDETSDEAASDDDGRYFDTEHRRQIYEESRLHHWRAVAYTAAFPGIGNFYAEQYALGTVAMMSMVFAGMFAGFGLMYNRPDLVRLGGVIAGITYVGSGVSSVLGVRSYNDNLRRSLHVDDERAGISPPRRSVWTVGWTWRF